MTTATAFLGLLIGVVTGLVGAGGGVLAVPALVSIIGTSTEAAVATSLLLGATAPLAALLPRLRGGVDWRTAGAVVLAGVPAAAVGTAAGAAVPHDALLLMFSAVMVIVGVRMLHPSTTAAADSAPRGWLFRCLGVGAVVGFLTGMLGVGGGFVTVPALVILLGMPMRRAVGTSLVVAVVNSLAGLLAHAGLASPDWRLTLAFTASALVGAFVGARLARSVSGRVLQTSFAVLVLAVACLIALQVLA